MHSKTEIIGYLGKDPEMRYTPQGQAVTSFSVATSHKYTNAGGEKISITTWFRVSAWGKRGEVCNQYLRKGMRVYVSGRLTPDPKTGGPRIWTRQNGTPGASFELNADQVLFLNDRPSDNGSGAIPVMEIQPDEVPVEDDIPF